MDAETHPEDLQRLLTELRRELNLLNTLNCNVHLYQGDFSIGKDEADKRTSAALDLYLAQLRVKVKPLFAELGRMLEQQERIGPVRSDLGEEMYYSAGAGWYQDKYLTGIMW